MLESQEKYSCLDFSLVMESQSVIILSLIVWESLLWTVGIPLYLYKGLCMANKIQEKLTEEEISLMETMFYPPALAECLFSDFNNMSDFDEKKFRTIRWYQYPMLSWESFYDFENSGLTEQQQFDLRKGASDCYCVGGRLTGKTAIFQVVDLLLRMVYSLFYGAEEIGFSAYVFNRIQKVLDKVTMAAKSHPFIKELFHCSTARSAPYTISANTGFKIFGINANVKGKTPGDSFYGLHLRVLFIEETSFETEKVYRARKHSHDELGCVFRQSGMTNFRKTSPIGQILKNPKNKNKILNLPQKVNPTYNKGMDEDYIDEFGGKTSEGYRIFCDGDIIEDRASIFDMEFIRDELVDTDVAIKNYDIDNDTFPMYATILNTIIRPNNANRIFIGTDIGRGKGIGSTEIAIFSEINTETLPVYKYLYNVTLSGLFDDELQKEIFKYLIDKLNAEMLSIDIGDGSIDKDELIILKVDNKIIYCRAKDLDKIKKSSKIEAPTWNNGNLEWKIASIFKHEYTGDMLEFKINPSSGTVKVTPNHSMMVFENGNLIEKEASKIKLNDWVVTPKKLLSKVSKYKFIKANFLGKENNIKVDEDFGYFIGWCAAEGCSKTTNYQLSLGDEKKEANNLLKLSRKIFSIKSGYINQQDKRHLPKRKFKKGYIHQNVITQTVVIGGGKGVLRLIEELVGVGAKNKKVPNVILNSPLSVKKAFLKGLVEGDGHIRQRKSKETTIKVISEKLVYGVDLILRNLNLYGTFGNSNEGYNTAYTISWTDNQLIGRWKGIPNNILNIKSGIDRLYKKVYSINSLIKRKVSKEKIKEFKKLLGYDFEFRKIIKINKYKYNDYVYDLMVNDNNTFVAGKGNVLIHNTGASIYNTLIKIYPKNIYGYYGNAKIVTGYQVNENGDVKLENNKPIPTEEFAAEFSVKRLQQLFYKSRILLPLDPKFDKQFDQVTALYNANRTIYKCMSKNDHLFDAFRVFAIAQWIWELKFLEPPKTKEMSINFV